MSAYPPVSPPPPTSNTLSSQQRSALVRSSKKLSKVLGDVPRVLDVPSSPPVQLTRTITTTTLLPSVTESIWHKRKPTHLPPLLKFPSSSIDVPNFPSPLTGSMCHLSPKRRDSVLSVAPSIVSNAPSTASGLSSSDVLNDATQRRTKVERLRRKLGDEVPTSAIFPTSPRTVVPAPRTPKSPQPGHRTRTQTRRPSGARFPPQVDDARSVAFSISSDESVHAVSLTAARVHTPRSRKSKRVYQTGPLPPIPSMTIHTTSASCAADGDDGDDGDAGLIQPRQKMAAGSMIGGSDFKAARRAKREGRAQSRMAEPGEVVEMVGFMNF